MALALGSRLNAVLASGRDGMIANVNLGNAGASSSSNNPERLRNDASNVADGETPFAAAAFQSKLPGRYFSSFLGRLSSLFGQKVRTSNDGIWRDAKESSIVMKGQRLIVPKAYRTVQLNKVALTQVLNQAPMEFSEEAKNTQVVMTLPMPDGSFARFSIKESPIMEPGLAAQVPEIKTYLGQGIDDRTATTRFDWMPSGFHAIVFFPGSTVYIDPYAQSDTVNYISYFKADVKKDNDNDEKRNFECQVENLSKDPGVLGLDKVFPGPDVASGTNLRIYRLALAATGEYTTFFRQPGDTDAQAKNRALEKMTTTVNRVSGIYEKEFASRLKFVDDELNIIYTDPATDPYNTANDETTLTQNQKNLDAVTVIGEANYDLGHLVTTGSGGIAGLGVACTTGQKARGLTGTNLPSGDLFDVDFVAHEMGHQFGGNHTFNSVSGGCGGGNRDAVGAYEPGSGSTVQSYAGLCSPENLQKHSHDYFNVKGLEETIGYTTTTGAGNCSTPVATGNNPPTVNAGANFTIPKQTPFTLTATGNDPDGDAVTFAWEEYDLGLVSSPRWEMQMGWLVHSSEVSPRQPVLGVIKSESGRIVRKPPRRLARVESGWATASRGRYLPPEGWTAWTRNQGQESLGSWGWKNG